jgi:uncharacterized protein (TIGR04255 family)
MVVLKPEKVKRTEIPPLLNSPLVEAIFELRWEILTDQQTGRMRDPAYPMMYGRLYERLKKDFPLIEDLPTTQVHPEANPYVVRHRLRKEKNGYPLFQVGPGVLTVNEAKGYSWSSFKSIILRLIESIVDLYPSGSVPVNFIKAEMRYVNGIRFDASRDHPLAFLSDKLHMKIELDPGLFAVNEMSDKPNGVSLNLAYSLLQPVGNLLLSAQLGQIDSKPSYVVQSVIQSVGEVVPHDKETFEPWLGAAHDVAENCFLALCKGPLLEKFCGS